MGHTFPTKLTILRPDGSSEEQTLWLPADLGYSRLIEIVTPLLDGGRLEHVSVLHDGRRADLFVDEDFVEKGLPLNAAASAIYRANAIAQNPEIDPETLPAIRGPAVLFDRRVWR